MKETYRKVARLQTSNLSNMLLDIMKVSLWSRRATQSKLLFGSPFVDRALEHTGVATEVPRSLTFPLDPTGLQCTACA